MNISGGDNGTELVDQDPSLPLASSLFRILARDPDLNCEGTLQALSLKRNLAFLSLLFYFLEKKNLSNVFYSLA